MRRAYKAYFQVPLGDQEKKWAPHIVCYNCEEMLRGWTKGKRKSLPFGIPMVWREPKDHLSDCYFLFGEHKSVLIERADKTSFIPVFHQLFDLFHTLIDSHLQSLMALYLLMKQVKVRGKSSWNANIRKQIQNLKTLLLKRS